MIMEGSMLSEVRRLALARFAEQGKPDKGAGPSASPQVSCPTCWAWLGVGCFNPGTYRQCCHEQGAAAVVKSESSPAPGVCVPTSWSASLQACYRHM